MSDKNYHPPVRLDPAAHDHLSKIIVALNITGRSISMTRYVSDLVLSQPIPNGHNHKTIICNECGQPKILSPEDTAGQSAAGSARSGSSGRS